MGGGPKSMASMRPPRQGIVGPPSSQLHRVPEAVALAYLCRRAVGPKVRTGTKPRVAASSSPITARVVHGGCRDHLRPQRRGVPPRLGLGLLPRPPSTAASNSKLEDERVPSTAFGAGGRRHRGQHRRKPRTSPAAGRFLLGHTRCRGLLPRATPRDDTGVG
jgi:hypothetical protein